jgi:DNA polymerase-3 subunit delta'
MNPIETLVELPPVLARLELATLQPRAASILAGSLARPVHAYLFLGPPGTGKRSTAIAAAAALVCPTGGCGGCASCVAALAGTHPDVVVVEREGAAIAVEEARELSRLAARGPAAGSRQVLVLTEFHLVDRAAPALLKTIEEPPPTTCFLILAEIVPPALVTIASRALEVPFDPLSEAAIVARLERAGVASQRAVPLARLAGGRLDRALLLAGDDQALARAELFASVPAELDGTGAVAAGIARRLLQSIDELVEVVRGRQAAELAALAGQAKQLGERGIPGRAVIEARHRREQRRVRTDELRSGLAVLARVYRDRALDHERSAVRLAALVAAVRAIDRVSASLARNPSELLQLEALLLELGQLS